MRTALHTFTIFLFRFLPLLCVVAVALIISYQNILPGTSYSGWDNILAEFNLVRYTRQVFGGGWIEHQGLGAPAAQGHLAEIPRLPILWLLWLIFPSNMLRYFYIFSLYTIGGVTMYFYLLKAWLDHKQNSRAKWLAALGGIFYLLHILTLQQFYISFEMFMAQFAFLPLLLLVVHRFTQPITAKTLLLFLGVQLLIAPSGHTSTVFYLAVLCSQLYGFFVTWHQGWKKAVWTGFLIGALTFVMNAYWIVPNIYYSIYDSRYVHESHDNRLFGTESVTSVKEAGTVKNFLQSTQYLFNWRDYSFERKEFDFIFNEWSSHLNFPFVSGLLMLFGVMTVLGVFLTVFARQKGEKRWAILLIYLGCVSFIWMGLFQTTVIFDWLYASPTFLEIFRNPFTKLSIIYSVSVVILFVTCIEAVISLLQRAGSEKLRLSLSAAVFVSLFGAIIYTAWPSFQGHFISEKLRIRYPEQYQEMFAFLQTQDRYARILQLPQLSHAGWEYYDWQFLGKGNGYQGMGFYFFGVPQPVLHRDFDRWVETSDFFYHELKYALDTEDMAAFQRVLDKYNVDLLVIDETRTDPYIKIDFAKQRQLAEATGFTKVWGKDFLSVYRRSKPVPQTEVLTPEHVDVVNTIARRVTNDAAFKEQDGYVVSNTQAARVMYPFAELTSREVSNVTYTPNGAEISTKIPKGEYSLRIPSLVSKTQTPVAISYQKNVVSLKLPKYSMTVGDKTTKLSSLKDLEFATTKSYDTIFVIFNNQVISIAQGQTLYPVIYFPEDARIQLKYAPKTEDVLYSPDGQIYDSSLHISKVDEIQVDSEFLEDQFIPTKNADTVHFSVEFPAHQLPLTQNPSVNCDQNERGSILTNSSEVGKDVEYHADGYGVNCNGIGLAEESSSQGYLLRVVGQNMVGRGMKLFVSYPESSALPDDYMFAEKSFDRTVLLQPISEKTILPIALNWETRSFGRENVTKLSQMSMIPVPLQQLGQVSVIKDGSLPPKNEVSVLYSRSYFDSVKVIRFYCGKPSCWLGLDQSYDDGWVAVPVSPGIVLEHVRYNSWANMWHVTGSGTVMIVYMPDLVALLSLILLIEWACYLVYRSVVKQK